MNKVEEPQNSAMDMTFNFIAVDLLVLEDLKNTGYLRSAFILLRILLPPLKGGKVSPLSRPPGL